VTRSGRLGSCSAGSAGRLRFRARGANRVSEGVWRVDQLPVPRSGRWQVRIDVLVSDFEKLILEDEVELR